MTDRIKDPQPGIRTIAGYQYHLHLVTVSVRVVQGEQLTNESERHTGLQDLILVTHLVVAIRINTLLGKHPMSILEIEQCPGRYGHYQFVIKTEFHDSSLALTNVHLSGQNGY